MDSELHAQDLTNCYNRLVREARSNQVWWRQRLSPCRCPATTRARYNPPVALREIDDKGRVRDVLRLDHDKDFDRVWRIIPALDRSAIETEINRRLDELINAPNPNWGLSQTPQSREEIRTQ